MDVPVLMPQLGNEINEAEITEWLKKPGDAVKEGDQILLITTPKISIEIEAPTSGILKSVHVEEGDLAEVGATLAVINAA